MKIAQYESYFSALTPQSRSFPTQSEMDDRYQQAAQSASPSSGAAADISQPSASTNTHYAMLSAQDVDDQEQAFEYPAVMNTTQGDTTMDLDAYYANALPPRNESWDLQDVPLILPTSDNINALKEHISLRFSEMLEQYGIPEAPENIRFNDRGEMVLPEDYAYADELKQAFAENEGLEREMRDLHAVSSHYAELQKIMPFVEAAQQVNSQAELAALVEQFSHLFYGNRDNSVISLEFSKSGEMSVHANGKPLEFA